jgi:hypothetical protein
MNASQSWQHSNKDMTTMPPPRQRGAAKKPMWIIVLLSLVCIALIGAYVYPPRHYSACYFFASSVCTPLQDWLPAAAQRERTDEEIISSVVIRDLLSMPMPVSKNPKIAFMFLTPGSLPFEKLWEKFLQVWCTFSRLPLLGFLFNIFSSFYYAGLYHHHLFMKSLSNFSFLGFCTQGHDGRYSIYIHASREKPVHSSSLFVGREIHSEKVPFSSHFIYFLLPSSICYSSCFFISEPNSKRYHQICYHLLVFVTSDKELKKVTMALLFFFSVLF